MGKIKIQNLSTVIFHNFLFVQLFPLYLFSTLLITLFIFFIDSRKDKKLFLKLKIIRISLPRDRKILRLLKYSRSQNEDASAGRYNGQASARCRFARGL